MNTYIAMYVSADDPLHPQVIAADPITGDPTLLRLYLQDVVFPTHAETLDQGLIVKPKWTTRQNGDWVLYVDGETSYCWLIATLRPNPAFGKYILEQHYKPMKAAQQGGKNA